MFSMLFLRNTFRLHEPWKNRGIILLPTCFLVKIETNYVVLKFRKRTSNDENNIEMFENKYFISSPYLLNHP